MRRAILLIAAMTIITTTAYAHRHDRPDLQGWLAGLHDKQGTSCCDSTEAVKIEDPDWDNDNGHYRVRIEGQWVEVPDKAVIDDPNRYGPALVWPWFSYDVSGKISKINIRCFLPGAGA